MEQNEVGFDLEIAKLSDALLQMAEESRVEARVVRGTVRCAWERVKEWLILVVCIALRKDTHAQLVKGSRSQGSNGLLLEFVSLMSPGVASGANWKVGRAIRTLEVPGVRNL